MFKTSAVLLLASLLVTAQTEARDESLAPTPPMGWNSWDCYGTTINESQFKANADWMAKHLKQFGWQYVVVDMEWFVKNPTAEGPARELNMDENGRYIPPSNRFPSAADGKGFKPLADYVHSLGLKFGIHILRGVPKHAVEQNLPISGTSYRAREIADVADTCPWNGDNYGIQDTPAGQAYYNSIAKLYASWDVDFVKADCIASHPYKGHEIRMLSHALRNAGRPIVLSLSPGPAPIEKADELSRYANMWRTSDDAWDLWHNDADFPKGVGDAFPLTARWAGQGKPGHWPDTDMLAIGYLGPAPGWEKPRQTRLTREEQRTLLTLWSMFRSPLMIGAELTHNDEWTTSLLTNPEVIAVDQHSTHNRVVSMGDSIVIWVAEPESGAGHYVAVFNRTGDSQDINLTWKQLGFSGSAAGVRDLWERKDMGRAHTLSVKLPPHGCVLYRVSE